MVHLNDKFVIGIGGVARCGKDTMARILSLLLQEQGFNVVIESFASPLKYEAQEFLDSKFGINVFTSDSRAKQVIRPFLVGLAEVHRLQTEGQFYWKALADRSLDLEPKTIILIPDLRFGYYSEDEIHFVNENGVSIHLELAKSIFAAECKSMPANDTERFNDPILKEKCKIRFNWYVQENPEEYYIAPIRSLLAYSVIHLIESKFKNI